MPAFNYHQKILLAVLDRGHKARGYGSAADSPKCARTARDSILIWTTIKCVYFVGLYARVPPDASRYVIAIIEGQKMQTSYLTDQFNTAPSI